MNEIDGKLVVLGGSRVASEIKGYIDEREYGTEVLAYDLDLSVFQFDNQKSKAKKTKRSKKGKKGKKSRGKDQVIRKVFLTHPFTLSYSI